MRLFLVTFLGLHLSGCAVTYINEDGATRRIGLLSVTESLGSCSMVQTITTAGVTLDTSPSTAGLSIGYRAITTTRSPDEGSVAFEMRQDSHLVSYDREGPLTPWGRIACR